MIVAGVEERDDLLARARVRLRSVQGVAARRGSPRCGPRARPAARRDARRRRRPRGPSQRITLGSISPCPTSVTMMTPKVANRIRSRCGNAAPPSIVSGMASAAASETTPRTPVNAMTNTHLPGRRGIAAPDRRNEPARQIGRRKHPDEARDDHDRGGDGGRGQQLRDREVLRLLDQGARLQAGDQEHEALDQVDDQVPEEDALKPRRRRDQPRPVPAHVEPGRDGREHAGAAEVMRHPEGEKRRHQRQRDLDPGVLRPVPQPQAQPADADAVDDLADHDQREGAGRLSAARTCRSRPRRRRSDRGSARWRRWRALRLRAPPAAAAAGRAAARSRAARPRPAATTIAPSTKATLHGQPSR